MRGVELNGPGIVSVVKGLCVFAKQMLDASVTGERHERQKARDKTKKGLGVRKKDRIDPMKRCAECKTGKY